MTAVVSYGASRPWIEFPKVAAINTKKSPRGFWPTSGSINSPQELTDTQISFSLTYTHPFEW